MVGYLSVEALDTDDEMSQICIYCGIIPDIVFGLFLATHLFNLFSYKS